MPSYLVTASDPLLLSQEVRKLLGDRDVESHYAGEIPLMELAARMSTLDLFASERGFWLRDVAALQASKKTTRELTLLSEAVPPDSVLVFSQNTFFGGDWRARGKFQSGALRKALASIVQQEVEVSLGRRQLAAWVENRALKQYELGLPEYQVEALIDSCVELPSLIDRELEKLALLKSKKGTGTITEAWFKVALAPTWSYQVGKIVDSVLAREPEAYKLLIRMYRREAVAPRLLSELYRGLVKLYWILSDSDFRSRPEFRGAQKWRIDRLRAASRMWQRESILKALCVITDTEFRQRTGRIAGRKSPEHEASLEPERDLLLVMLKRLYRL